MYVTGHRVQSSSSANGIALEVLLGGRDNEEIVDGISGGWVYNFVLPEEVDVLTVEFGYKLTLSGTYESEEFVEVIVSLDDYSTDDSTIIVADANGKGEENKIAEVQSKQATFSKVPAGNHAITIGG